MEVYQVVDENGDDAEGLFEGNLAVFASRAKAHDYMDYLIHDVEVSGKLKIVERELL